MNDQAKTKVILNVFQMFLTFVRELLLDAQNDNPLETPEQLQEFLDWLVTTLRILPDKENRQGIDVVTGKAKLADLLWFPQIMS